MKEKLPKEITSLIEKLNEEQLDALYRFVVERLRILHNMRALYAMRKFSIMDRVSFSHNGKCYEGLITRLNQKSVTVTLNDGNRWNVSPGSLKKVNMENPLKALLTKE